MATLGGPLLLHGIYIIDADNTLWDTHGVFVAAYRHMVSVLTQAGYSFSRESFGLPYTAIRSMDRLIAHALRDYEYDFTLLALSLIHHARGHDFDAAVHRALNACHSGTDWKLAGCAAHSFYEHCNATQPRLFPQAAETLAALMYLGNVLILHSEGKADRVRETLDFYDLADYFHDLVLEPKSHSSFKRARGIGLEYYRWLADIPPQDCVVVGDSPPRDILFGNLIGAHTILTPALFWGAELPNDPLQHPDYTIKNLLDILHLSHSNT